MLELPIAQLVCAEGFMSNMSLKQAIHLIAMFAILLAFSPTALADKVVNGFNEDCTKKSNRVSEPRMQTVGMAGATCAECWKQSAMSLSPYQDLCAISQKVAIFDADPSTPEWDDPREELDIPGIGVAKVTGNAKPRPHSNDESDAKAVGAGRYVVMGTTFMINECLAMTNHHVANLHSNSEDVSDRKIEVFQRDRQPDGTFSQPIKSEAQVVAGGNFRGGIEGSADWSLIKTDRLRRDKAGIIPICPFDLTQVANITKNGGFITSASFFTDKGDETSSKLWGQKKCRIYGPSVHSKERWATNCPSIAGASGSPVLANNGKGQICALGILTGSVTTGDKVRQPSEQQHNIMIPFSAPGLYQQIKKAIDENKCVETTRT